MAARRYRLFDLPVDVSAGGKKRLSQQIEVFGGHQARLGDPSDQPAGGCSPTAVGDQQHGGGGRYLGLSFVESVE